MIVIKLHNQIKIIQLADNSENVNPSGNFIDLGVALTGNHILQMNLLSG